MISKHVSCKPENDDYGRLARYIADAGHEGMFHYFLLPKTIFKNPAGATTGTGA